MHLSSGHPGMQLESRNAIAGMGAKASAELITELFPPDPPSQDQIEGGVVRHSLMICLATIVSL